MSGMSRTSADLPGFPAELAAEFDAATARMDEIYAQIDALREELTPLAAQRKAAVDLYAETTDDPVTLLALSNTSKVARDKVLADVRALHPYMYEVNEYLIPDWDDDGKPKGAPTVLIGPHVSLMQHSKRPLDPAQAETLSEALVAFAARYVPDPTGLLPEWGMGAHPGMIQCDLLTEHDDRPVIWYSPDGEHAAYYQHATNGHTGYSGPITDTLTAVLRRAINDAARPVRSDEDTDY